MEVTATHYNARLSPQKARLYRVLLKGLAVTQADSQLRFMPGKAPRVIRAVLHSAVANAKHNFAAAEQNLVVSDVVINAGFTLKRFRPVSKGTAHSITKRTAHVTVVVREKA